MSVQNSRSSGNRMKTLSTVAVVAAIISSLWGLAETRIRKVEHELELHSTYVRDLERTATSNATRIIALEKQTDLLIRAMYDGKIGSTEGGK